VTDVQDVRLDQFATLYEKLDGIHDDEANWNLKVLGQARAERLKQSIAHNSDMFLSPFGGLIVQGAAHSFIYQLFANRSAEHPDGFMNRNTLKSVFAVSVCDEKELGKCDCSFVPAGENGHKYKYVRG
jgi:hypothetical protein